MGNSEVLRFCIIFKLYRPISSIAKSMGTTLVFSTLKEPSFVRSSRIELVSDLCSVFLINSKSVDTMVGTYFLPPFSSVFNRHGLILILGSGTVLGIQDTEEEVVPARSWGCRLYYHHTADGRTGSEKLSGSEPGYPKGFH